MRHSDLTRMTVEQLRQERALLAEIVSVRMPSAWTVDRFASATAELIRRTTPGRAESAQEVIR